MTTPESIDGIPAEALAEIDDDIWVGFDVAQLADVLCGYVTGEDWVIALAEGTVTLPDAVFSDSKDSAVRLVVLARAVQSTSYCPTSTQSERVGGSGGQVRRAKTL